MKLVSIFVFVFLLSGISALCEDGQIDINTASASELDELYGIGPVKAQAIIDARPFDSIDNLIDVYGIGDATLRNIKSQGLACVEEEHEKHEEEIESEENKIPETTKVIEPKEDVKTIELSTISLNTKDIKSENNNETLKNNLAFYGIITFCVVFSALFLLKGKKYKNEFQ